MLVRVRVTTGAKNERMQKCADDRFEICVREKPQNNAANHRVLTLIAAHFRVASNKVHIKSGHHRPSKLLTIAV